MIVETLKYCFHFISCPKYIRELGLLSDLIGIESRYSRCKQAWQPHLENSRRVILDSAQGLKKRDRVIIFGAGSLHDVPLKKLSEIFTEVHLVDIFFLQDTVNKIKRYSNVEFHEMDLTGILEKAFATMQRLKIGTKKLEVLKYELDTLSTFMPKHFPDEEFDLVISLNLLSQLPMALKNYIEKLNIPHLANDEIFNHFYRNLILNHLSFLRSFAVNGAKVLLISDTEKMVYNHNKELKACESSLEGLDESIFKDWDSPYEWDWDLAPIGELDSQYSLQLKIKVFRINAE